MSNSLNSNRNNDDDEKSEHVPTPKPKSLSNKLTLEWNEMKPSLSSSILEVVKFLNYPKMTHVQAAVIPSLLSYKDVSVQARTGSGKSISFVIPCIQILLRMKVPLKTHQIGVIVIEPTRELATQIITVFQPFIDAVNKCSSSMNLRILHLIGGNSITESNQEYTQNGGNIIVATPGRLESVLCKSGLLDVKSLEVLILDEADRLLELGFEQSLNAILKRLPKQRRTGIFSATQTQQLKHIQKVGMRDPVNIKVNVQIKNSTNSSIDNPESKSAHASHQQQLTPDSLTNEFVILPVTHKLDYLLTFLNLHSHNKIIVFFLTCAQVDYYNMILKAINRYKNVDLNRSTHHNAKNKQKQQHTKQLNKSQSSTANSNDLPDSSTSSSQIPYLNRPIYALHGKLSNAKRKSIFAEFSSSSNNAILLCTDVVARGIDIVDIELVVQFDAPQDDAFFIHRCGRTARMGRQGHALLMLSQNEDAYVHFLKRKNVPICERQLTDEEKSIIGDDYAALIPASTNTTPLDTSSNAHSPAFKIVTSAQPPTLSDIKSQPSTSDPHSTLLLSHIRSLSLSDRCYMECAQNAFVSYIRAYKEHKLSLIFQFSELEFLNVATGMGLIYMPKLTDLQHMKLKGKFKPVDVKPSEIKFADAKREKQRLENSARLHEKRLKEQHEREAKEAAFIEKRKQSSSTISLTAKKKKRKTVHLQQEWNELQADARAIKKLKSKKISKQQLDDILQNNHQDDFDIDIDSE